MMKFGKIITFVFQALLVILAVVIFSYFDPFNIFNRKKLSMKDTPIIVSSIKSVGELITAEYYGEIIKATGEELEDSVQLLKTRDSIGIVTIQREIITSIDSIKSAPKSKRDEKINEHKLLKQFREEYKNITTSSVYSMLIEIAKKSYDLNEGELLYYYYNNTGHSIDEYKPEEKKPLGSSIDLYLTNKYKPSKKETRQTAKHALVILGRGSVKAGIDFSNFDEQHLSYLPDKNLIRLFYSTPQIISATINPWFIPEKKIKGFEYLYVGNKINNSSESSLKLVQEIKTEALDNLRHDALDAGILEEAKKQAEVSLSHLLSLLLEKEIKVEIYSDPMTAFLDDMFSSSNHNITKRDIESIDSIVGSQSNVEPLLVLDFLKTINDTLDSQPENKNRLLPWKGADQNWSITSFYFKVSNDGFSSKTETDTLAKYTSDSLAYLNDYLYYAVQDSIVEQELMQAKFNITVLSDLTKKKVQNSKKVNLDSLSVQLKKLHKL